MTDAGGLLNGGRSALHRVAAAYRRSGADLPYGDPLPTHGAEMEGWFWRITDSDTGRAVVVLCGVNRHPDGDWATVALALHPGGVVKSAALDEAHARRDCFELAAGTQPESRIEATADRLSVDLDGAHVDMQITDSYSWPKAFGGGGVFSAVPFLNQYWHPYRLRATATGTVRADGEEWSFDGARAYSEKNWGAGFPDRWWWGQAHDFDDADISVAFSGGVLSLGPIAGSVGGVVVRLGERLIRITPPDRVRSEVGTDTWAVRATSLRHRVELFGDGRHLPPHVLPVPLPAERRNVDTDFEHLAGRLHCVVRERGKVLFEGTSEMAGLEVGSLPEPA